MSTKRKVTATVVSQEMLSEGIYDLRVQTDLAKDALAGQFAALYPADRSTLLPRPISICEADGDEEILRMVYRIAGKGTQEFSGLKSGDAIELLGVLGNGFPIGEAAGKKVVLMGGGIGIPPMLGLARALKEADQAAEIHAVLGYRNADLFLAKEFEAYAQVHIATEDGSVGVKGNVLTLMAEEKLGADVIMACGPMPMLRAIAAYAKENGCRAFVSLEERMACGVGACLGCVAKTKEIDHHSHVKNARICTDGPVFDVEVLDL